MKHATIFTACALGVLLLAAVAQGAGTGIAELQRIQTLQQKGALGGESDKNPYTLAIREQVRAFLWTTNTITLTQATEFGAKLVGELHNHVAKHMESMADNTVMNSGSFRPALDRAWQQVLDELARTQSDLKAGNTTSCLDACWQFNHADFSALESELLIGKLIADIATSNASQEVVQAWLHEMENIVTTVELTRRVLLPIRQVQEGDFANKTGHTDKEWSKFFDAMKPEWPWETATNTSLYSYRDDAGRFNVPPVSQWVVMHLSAGYEVRGFDQEDLAPTLLLEVIGYNRLSWDSSGEISEWPVGISLAGCYQLGNTDIKRGGIGIMVNIKSYYGLGVFVHDPGGENEFAAVLNFDLATFFQSKVEDSKKVLEYVGVK